MKTHIRQLILDDLSRRDKEFVWNNRCPFCNDNIRGEVRLILMDDLEAKIPNVESIYSYECTECHRTFDVIFPANYHFLKYPRSKLIDLIEMT